MPLFLPQWGDLKNDWLNGWVKAVVSFIFHSPYTRIATCCPLSFVAPLLFKTPFIITCLQRSNQPGMKPSVCRVLKHMLVCSVLLGPRETNRFFCPFLVMCTTTHVNLKSPSVCSSVSPSPRPAPHVAPQSIPPLSLLFPAWLSLHVMPSHLIIVINLKHQNTSCAFWSLCSSCRLKGVGSASRVCSTPNNDYFYLCRPSWGIETDINRHLADVCC